MPDHVSLILASGEDRIKRSKHFYFELGWFEVEGFIPLLLARWELARTASGRSRGPLDTWISAAGALRGFLRGWGANHGSEAVEQKKKIYADRRNSKKSIVTKATNDIYIDIGRRGPKRGQGRQQA